jgi:bifunctional UDP-N-acetylglucosamine pyrophosphorylase/glucosamine-1-phosphate N-acetyltransferase
MAERLSSVPLVVIILAAGQGTRMRSVLPKVLHKLAHLPLLEHVCRTAESLQAEDIYVVYGHGGEQVRECCRHLPCHWIEQDRQLGTGHAVNQVAPYIKANQQVLVLFGDVPLVQATTLQALRDSAAGGLALLTVEREDPAGYGRITRDQAGKVIGIVEHKDADPASLAIREVNTGIMLAPAGRLPGWLARLENSNSQNEYYLTDIVAMAVADGIAVEAVKASSPLEVSGVNDRLQLAALERYYQHMNAEELMQQGVTVRDPARLDIRGEISCGQDVILDVNVILEGKVSIGNNVCIGANVIIRDSTIADGAVIEANSIIEKSEIGAGCSVGPFARLRPGTRLAAKAKVGNFVEIKNALIGDGSKVNHLSYIGDATLGVGVNIGAGTITCNYDGANKHQTTIGDHAFIGSNTQLVAPVSVGKGATIGAGSTITRDAPADALTLTRSAQKTLTGWQRPVKKQD